MKNDIQKTGKLATIISTLGLFVLSVLPASAQVTPGGTVGDAAIYIEAEGGEALVRAAAGGAYGPTLVHDFDTEQLADATYKLNPSGADATQIALSSGRHLVLYNTRFRSPSGGNRAEIQGWLTLGANELAGGRSQGYIRRTGNADEAVLSGGAIITSSADDTVLTLSSRRSDTNAAHQPARNGAAHGQNKVGGSTAIQFFKLDDSWDYLSLELGADILLANNANYQTIAYDTNASPDTLGAAFSVDGGAVTLNEEGLYLVLANTGLLKPTNNTRTNYLQHLTLDGTEVAGSVTTTYIRGNEDTQEGVASLGMVVRATAGQVLSLQVRKETGTRSTAKAGQAALNIVKLPGTAAFLALGDATNQEINDVANPDPATFADQLSVPSKFSHTIGGSEVSVNEAGNYLFLANVYTQSDGTNDNQDRTVPLHGWQVNSPNGASGMLPQGRGAQYNRDNGNRISGSWGAGILPLDAGMSVQLLTSRLGNADQGLPNTLSLQALNLKSLVPSNDPVIAVNESLSLIAGQTGVISSDYLSSVDADDAADALTYTVTDAITGGRLANGDTVLALGDTFTQADIDAGALTYTAGNEGGAFGFDFEVVDDSGSGAEASGYFAVNVGDATDLADDTGATDEDTALSGLNVLANDAGSSLSVVKHDAQSALGARVVVDAEGNVTYDPSGAAGIQASDDGESQEDSFTVTINDFAGVNTTTTVTITVTGLNDVPVVAGESATAGEGSVTTLNLLANDSDVDAGDVITVSGITTDINGHLLVENSHTFTSPNGSTVSVAANGAVSYDRSTSSELNALADGASASETFTYTVSDATATVEGSATFTTVGDAGSSADLATVNADGTINIDALGNDTNYSGELGTATAGAGLDLNAATAGNTDGIWNNAAVHAGSLTMDAAGTGSVLNLAPAGAPAGVTAAYTFNGAGGAILIDPQTPPSIYGPADITRGDASIELVFRPADQQDAEPLWGGGGNGTGASIILLENQVVLTVCQGAIVAQAIASLPAGAIAGGDFVHVLGTIDLANDSVALYVNNALAATGSAINITNGAAADLNKWAGADDEGIARSQGTTGGDTGTAPGLGAQGTKDIPDFNEANDRFEGDITIVRVYTSVLDADQRAANFAAIYGAAVTPGAASIANLAGTANPAVGTPVSLPSGATVTIEADGTLTYDPAGAFAGLGTGLSVTETFNYTLDGNLNTTATVNVTVNGSNTDPQVTIAADQGSVTEGTDAGFTLSATAPVTGAVEIALAYSGTAADGADFTGVAAATIADGASSADLDLATIADSLYEGGSETVAVTITGINSGAGILGATTSAATAIDDGDNLPEYTIAADSASVNEGGEVVITISASGAAAFDADYVLSYSGDTTPGSDFIVGAGETANVLGTIPAGSTSSTITLGVLEDGKVEGAETLNVNIDRVTLGISGSGYAQDFDDFADGTKDLGDGTVMFGTANIQGGALELTRDGVGGGYASFSVPPIANSALGWQATFDLTISDGVAANNPADGMSFNYGNAPLGDEGSAEEGMAGRGNVTENISYEIDTWQNFNTEQGVNIAQKVGGTDTNLAHNNGPVLIDGTTVGGPVSINWDSVNGASFATNGLVTNADFVDVESAFVGDDAYTFIFSGRVGGAHETKLIDNLVINRTVAGAIGAAAVASVTVNDGAGSLVFFADFEGVTAADTTGGTLLNADAPEAANAGTAVGSWSNVPGATASGLAPGLVLEKEDTKGDGLDHHLRVDRPAPATAIAPGGTLAYTEVTANFAATIDLSGANTGLITMDLGQSRTQNNTEDKSSYITGYDSAGNVSFRLFLSANNNGANDERLHHVAADGTLTPLGSREDFRNVGAGGAANAFTFDEGDLTGLAIALGSAGYQVSIDRGPVLWTAAGLIDGTYESTSGVLAYAGNATQVSKIVFSVSTSTNTGVSGGIWVDDLCAGGIAANQAPGLSTDVILVDGGSTEFDDSYVIGSTIPFSETEGNPLQVSDPDAGNGTITVRMQSITGLSVFDVLSLEGDASITSGSNNSGDLTLSGTLADINATLAAGVNLIAGNVAGQETLTVTVDDGGNTGFGGALTVTHSAVVNITSNPITTVNQAAGQEDPTSVEVINFTASFSEDVEGLEAADVDLSGSSAAGNLVATLTGGPQAYSIAVTGMTGSGSVVVSLAEGVANRVGDAGAPSGASTSTDNSVSFEKNLAPVATNTDQTINYTLADASVAIGDIVVSDGNESLSTAGITTETAAFIDYPAVDTTKSFTSAVTPDVNNGFSLAIKFTPVAADVEAGSEVAGQENRHRVYEYGGGSNGHGLYLVNGVLYFACKMNTTGASVPSSLNDTDWADDSNGDGLFGSVMFPLTGALAADEEVSLAMIFDLNSVRYSVNGAAEVNQALSGRGTRNNWRGNRTFNIGTSTQSGQGGLANIVGSTYKDTDYVAMGGDNPVASVQVYNVSGEDAAINILGEGQEITATLTLDDATNGALSAGSGNGESYNAETGVWSVSGSSITVNAALAAVSFVPSGREFPPLPASVDVSFSVEDDNEDGSDPVRGTITLVIINSPPTGTVTISGLAEEDQVLTADNDLNDVDGLGAITYQWLRDGAAVDGATATTYQLGASDVGSVLSLSASYVDGLGNNESVTSAATDPVTSAPTPIEDWRVANGYSADGSGAGEGNLDVSANGRTNLENFALGFDASGTGSDGEITVDANGAITAVGGVHIHQEGGKYYLRYTRRADFANAGLTITEEFSGNADLLLLWEPGTNAASVIGTGSNGGIAIVALQVELPAGSNFARLKVSTTE